MFTIAIWITTVVLDEGLNNIKIPLGLLKGLLLRIGKIFSLFSYVSNILLDCGGTIEKDKNSLNIGDSPKVSGESGPC